VEPATDAEITPPPWSAEARPDLNLKRIFDAPRDLVWLAWTRPGMTVRWLGPVEWPAMDVRQDLRVGGEWSAVLKSADDDRTLWQGGIYHEIDPPARLVFSFKWGDGHEDGPAVETLVTIVLTELPDGRTMMDFTHEGLKSAESLAGHRHGWTSSFQRLDQWLATRMQQERPV
jgi:uncharacterized protein YndB with AHSA1/START domain